MKKAIVILVVAMMIMTTVFNAFAETKLYKLEGHAVVETSITNDELIFTHKYSHPDYPSYFASSILLQDYGTKDEVPLLRSDFYYQGTKKIDVETARFFFNTQMFELGGIACAETTEIKKGIYRQRFVMLFDSYSRDFLHEFLFFTYVNYNKKNNYNVTIPITLHCKDEDIDIEMSAGSIRDLDELLCAYISEIEDLAYMPTVENMGVSLEVYVKYKGVYIKTDSSDKKPDGWNVIDDKIYYKNLDGSFAKGWTTILGNQYYFFEDGSLGNGWIREDDNWYYIDVSGIMSTGWVQDSDAWYYLSEDGIMLTGWVNIDNVWYYMNEDGRMRTGWLQDESNWYYLQSDGSMAKNTTLNINGVDYTFSASGALQ